MNVGWWECQSWLIFRYMWWCWPRRFLSCMYLRFWYYQLNRANCGRSIWGCFLTSLGIPIIRYDDRPIFIMGILILVRWSLFTESGQRNFQLPFTLGFTCYYASCVRLVCLRTCYSIIYNAITYFHWPLCGNLSVNSSTNLIQWSTNSLNKY